MTLPSRRSLLTTASLLAALACTACSSQPGSHEVMVPFSNLPAPAQKTIVKELSGQTPELIEIEHKDGMEVYEAKALKADGSKEIVKVDTDGNLLLVKKKPASVDIAWNKLPKAVRKTIAKNNGGMQVDTVEKEKENGVTIYEAHICTPDGLKHVIKVTKSGKLITKA